MNICILGWKLNLLIACLTIGLEMPALCQVNNSRTVTMDEVVNMSLTMNPRLKSAQLKVDAADRLSQKNVDLGATNINYQYGWGNSAMYDRNFEVEQNIGSPVLSYNKRQYAKEVVNHAKAGLIISKKQLTFDVKTAYTQWVYFSVKSRLLEEESHLYEESFKFENIPDSAALDIRIQKLAEQSEFAKVQNQSFQAEQSYLIATNQMKELLYSNEALSPADSMIDLYVIKSENLGSEKFYPIQHYYYLNSLEKLRNSELIMERSKYFPEIKIGYFSQKIGNFNNFQGYKVGLSFPIWFSTQKANVDESRLNREIARNDDDYQKFIIEKKIENLKIQLDQLYVSITNFRENALPLASLKEERIMAKLKIGESDHQPFMDELSKILKIRLEYLETLRDYNLTAIQLEFYIN